MTPSRSHQVRQSETNSSRWVVLLRVTVALGLSCCGVLVAFLLVLWRHVVRSSARWQQDSETAAWDTAAVT